MNLTTTWQHTKWLFIGVVLLLVALIVPTSIVAYLVTLIFAVFTFLKPKESLFFLLLYFPTRSFLIEINPSLKLLGDIIIIVAFLRVVWDSRKDWKSIFRFEKFEWAFIAFLAVGSIAALLTGVSFMAIVFQLRAFVITFLLIYIVKRLSITKEDVKKFLWTTAIVATVMVIQGIVEKLSMRSAWMPEKWINRALSPNNASRVYGLINNPNVLAVYLTIAGILVAYLKQLLPKTKIQWTLNVLLVLIAGVWFLTYSRGTWIALVIGVVVYVIFTRNYSFFIKTAITIALGFVLVALPANFGAKWISENTQVGDIVRTGPADEPDIVVQTERFKTSFSGSTFEKSLTTGRLFVVMKGFEIFADHPVIGTGFATYGDSATKSYLSPIYENYGITYNIYSDNQYIQIIVQTGAVGVILFAIFLLGMLFMFWKYRKTTPYAVPMLAALLGVLACGFLYNIWEDKTFTMYYYMLTGAFIALVTQKERSVK